MTTPTAWQRRRAPLAARRTTLATRRASLTAHTTNTAAHRGRPLAAAVTAAALALLAVATTSPGPAAAAETVSVSTAAQLKSALAAATPGQTIHLADGVYTGNFKVTGRPATASAPIALEGSANAVLRTSSGGGNVLQLTDADHWTIRGITVQNAQKGIMVDSSDHVTIDGVTVHDLTMEGVHFRMSSSYGVLQNSRIFDTGQDGRGMGEGVYVGSANTYSDTSDHVQILDNVIGPLVRGENVDIKEGTRGGRIAGNTFYGDGLTGANYDDSWVDVKGNDYVVEDNIGVGTTKSGFQTHQQSPGWGCGTTFRNNSSDLSGAVGPGRYAIEVTVYDAATCPVTVTSDNTVVGGDGLVNPGIPVSPVGGGPSPEPSPTPEPTPSPTPSPSPSPTTPACTAPAWSAGAVYTGGATVSHAGSTYTARWWTQGETPGTSQWGAWAVVGTC
ncbi:carbohydrate-binding protein [Oerskovia enterophila]|uniref:carbohydrate-binding protein n=1 Tax=Oerskovia enterophila TaxID=43678 RepID=UPI0033934734